MARTPVPLTSVRRGTTRDDDWVKAEIDRVRASRAALALALPTDGVTVSPDVTPEAIAEAAAIQGIAVEVHRAATSLGLDDLAQALKPAATSITVNGMHMFVMTNRLVDLFESARIPCAVVKGFGLAQLTRPNPFGRPATDVDILIPPDRVVAAHRLLLGRGCSLAPGFIPPDDSRAFSVLLKLRHEATYGFEGQKLDLHWHLGSARRMLATTQDALKRSVTVETNGVRMPTLSLHDALVHSAVHWRMSGFRGLKYVLDLEALRAKLSPDELSALAAYVKRVLIVARRMRTSTPQAQPTGWVPSSMWNQAYKGLGSNGRGGIIDTRVRLASFVAQLRDTPGPDRLVVPLNVGIGPALRQYRRVRGL